MRNKSRLLSSKKRFLVYAWMKDHVSQYTGDGDKSFEEIAVRCSKEVGFEVAPYSISNIAKETDISVVNAYKGKMGGGPKPSRLKEITQLQESVTQIRRILSEFIDIVQNDSDTVFTARGKKSLFQYGIFCNNPMAWEADPLTPDTWVKANQSTKIMRDEGE